jgi:hypothetical protein
MATLRGDAMTTALCTRVDRAPSKPVLAVSFDLKSSGHSQDRPFLDARSHQVWGERHPPDRLVPALRSVLQAREASERATLCSQWKFPAPALRAPHGDRGIGPRRLAHGETSVRLARTCWMTVVPRSCRFSPPGAV